MTRLSVFLSGTRRDLAPFHEAARRAIQKHLQGIDVVMMETCPAEDIPIRRWSNREARSCEVLIGLVGQYAGTPRAQGALTEAEFDVAGQAGVERLMFLTDHESPALAAAQSPEEAQALEGFRARLGETVVKRDVANADQYAEEVVKALEAWRRRTLNGRLVPARTYVAQFNEQTANTPFSREIPYIGGERGLQTLADFASKGPRVLLIYASWGVGKTRLLTEWADSTPARVSFLRRDQRFDDPGEAVAVDDDLIIVVDDAHQRDANELRFLLAFLQGRGSTAKLILACRTQLLQTVEPRLRENRFAPDEIQRFEVPELSTDDHRRLVFTVAGGESERAAAIARRTQRSPLAAIIAATQLRKGKLTLQEIEDADFIEQVIKRYSDVLEVDVENPIDRDRYGKELDLIALVGPIRPADSGAIEELAAFLGVRKHVLMADLQWLEKARQLSRVGGLLRVPVDAIGEQRICSVAVTERGESTGFVEAVLTELTPFTQNVLRNMAATDAASADEKGRLAATARAVWRLLPDFYRSASGELQLGIAEAIEGLAGVYPSEALAFALQHVDLPPNPADSGVSNAWRTDRLRQHWLSAAAGAARVGPHVSTACDLLWRFASASPTGKPSAQETAEKALTTVGEYDRFKDLDAYSALVRWAASRWDARSIPGHRLALYLAPLLSKEVRSHWSDGKKVTFQSRPLIYEPLKELRRKAIDLLARIGRGGTPADARQAMTTLAEGLQPPFTYRGPAPVEEQRQWAEEHVAVLEAIGSIVTEQKSAAVALALPHAVRRTTRDPSPAVSTAARQVLETADGLSRNTLEQRLVRPPERRSSYQALTQEFEGQLQTAAAELVQQDPSETLQRVTTAVLNLEAVGLHPSAPGLAKHVALASPRHAMTWFDLLLSTHAHPLRGMALGLVYGMAPGDAPAARQMVARCLESGDPEVLLPFRLSDYDIELLGDAAVEQVIARMLTHANSRIREQALGTIAAVERLPLEGRRALLLGHDLTRWPMDSDHWSNALLEGGLYDSLSAEEKAALPARFVRVPSLDYWVLELFQRLAKDAPGALVRAMTERLKHAGEEGFDAFHADEAEFIRDLPAAHVREALLSTLQLLKSADIRIAFTVQQWFNALQAAHLGVARSIRQPLIQDGSREALGIAVQTFAGADPEQLFADEKEVVAILERAEKLDPPSDWCRQELLRTMWTGAREGTPGEPFPRDVALKEAAAEALARYPAGSVGHRFFKDYLENVEERIASHLARDEELE